MIIIILDSLSFFVKFVFSNKTNVVEQYQINRIKDVLQSQKRTNRWLAEKTGKTEITVSRWVQNRMQPSLEQLTAIADALNVDIKDLLNSTKPHNK